MVLLSLAGGADARTQQSQALAIAVDGPGKVTGSGIDCGDGTTNDCVEIFATGTPITLTAVPNAGATFAGWGGDCSGTATTCTFTMDSAKAVTATFTSGSSSNPTLTVTVTGNGTVTGPGISCGGGSTDCSESYATGSTISLTETPSAGATFGGWGASCSGTAATCTVVMSASKSVSATFTGGASTSTLTVSVTGNGKVTGPGINCGSGSTDCTEAYTTGTAVTLTAAPNTGATFTGWSGSCSGAIATCTVSMTSSKTVGAVFTTGTTSQATLTVTVTGSGRVVGLGINCGSGFTDCSENYTLNASVTLTATPNTGATFAGWGGSCSGTSSTCTVVMSASKSATATFNPSTMTQRILTVTVGGAGKVTGTGINCGNNATDCSGTYNNGTSVTLAAAASTGAVFLGWGGACSGTATTCTVVMDAPKAVSASFSTPGGGGGTGGTLAARSLGAPLVVRSVVGWAVTLRFYTSRSASALLQLTLNGRLVNAFTFNPRAGDVLVGPFNVGTPGQYRFLLSLSDGRGGTADLIWSLCLSNTGGSECGSFRPPTTNFVRSLGVSASRTGGGWLVRVRFQAGRAGTGTVRMYRNSRLVSSGTFTFNRGRVFVDLPARQSGYHRIVLTARDVAGRTASLRWNVAIF